jgi:brefeldin A-resistance guanine nucleotide exchange factor 1
VCSLLAATARHPEAAEPGFEALTFIMQDAQHITPVNFLPCMDAALAFAEGRVGGVSFLSARLLWMELCFYATSGP